MIDPKDQFQIGDKVLFIPEGIFALVTGYEWGQKIGGAPYVARYVLDCGIASSKANIKKA